MQSLHSLFTIIGNSQISRWKILDVKYSYCIQRYCEMTCRVTEEHLRGVFFSLLYREFEDWLEKANLLLVFPRAAIMNT